MTRRSAIILTVVLATVIVAMFVGVGIALRSARKSQVHLIPDGYTGWVSVAYGVKGAPPLSVEDGHQVLRYDDEGKLETSTPFEEGWSVDAFYYDRGDTRQPLRQLPPGFDGRIWGSYTSSTFVRRVQGKLVRQGVSAGFFVGTEQEYLASRGP
jgi:hypothetical protein